MILYFADRHLNILGQASTKLPKGIRIIDDLKSSDVETGVSVFECDIAFSQKTRKQIEDWAEVGNYVFRSLDGEGELYNIIDAKIDTKKQRVSIYAEDDGLDLLNDIAPAYEADDEYPVSSYIERFASNSGWEIGINEVEGLTKKLSFDNEQTVSARLISIAEDFGCEFSFSFKIDGLKIVKRYINIFQKRGKDIGISLRLSKELDSIIVEKSISNLATALNVKGSTPVDGETPITLLDYEYDDGDFYVDGTLLKSRQALKKWSRYLWNDDDTKQSGGHIVKSFSYDTTSKAILCEKAIEQLKSICDMQVNYEVDINRLPDNVAIGDRVNIVDDAGELYLSTRLLKLEQSETNQEYKATLGEHLIKSSGISQKVEQLAQQFAISSQETKKALEKAEQAKNTADNANETANSASDKAQEATEATEKIEQDISNFQQSIDEVNEAAQNADKAAQEAKDAATNAQTKAQEAEKYSTEAKTNAESALSEAKAATQTASQAKSEAENASATAAAAKADAENAKADIAKWESELKTVTNTMEADYARKTELTETTASLQSQISQNAGEISSTIKSIETIDETVSDVQSQVETAQSTADAAKAQADKACSAASAAQKAADNASSAAKAAQNEADTAKSNATLAQEKADTAAANAKKAQEDLDAAKKNLDSVSSKVDAAQEDIDKANKAVETAQATADSAAADAATAQSAADKAKSDAATAQSKANEAKTAADKAQAKANEAKSAADKAQEDVDALAVRVTNAETSITQTKNDITLLATKEEVTETLSGYYTKTETTAQIQTKANSITSTVAATYATKTSVSELSSQVTQTESKISWLVKSGTSSTNFTITDRLASLTADYINLNGLVSFSGLNSSVQTTINNASSNASTALSTANSANSTANTAQSTANSAQSTANTANSTANSAATKLASWASKNDTTYIDGGKIYTSSITADKLNVTSLSAICAKIGGFTIGDSTLSVESGGLAEIIVNYVASSDLGEIGYVRLGSKTSEYEKPFEIYGYDYANGKNSLVTMDERGININNLYITGDTIGTGEDTLGIAVSANSDDINERGKIAFIRETDIGTNTSPTGNIYLGAKKRIFVHGGAPYAAGEEFQLIGYQEYMELGDTAGGTILVNNSMVLPNNKFIYGKTASGAQAQLIGLSGSDNLVLGVHEENTVKNAHIYVGDEVRMYQGTGKTLLFQLTSSQAKIVPVSTKTTSSGSYVKVGSTGILYKETSSSERYKHSISRVLSEPICPEKLYDLPVVEYVYNDSHLPQSDKRYGKKFIGLIAEDVDRIYPLAADYNDEGLVENWNIRILVPGMLKLIQDQHQTDELLTSRLDNTDIQVLSLKTQLADAMAKLALLQEEINALKSA